MRLMRILFLIILLLLFSGCGASSGSGNNISVTSGSNDDTLGTLSIENRDLKETLTAKNWKTLTMDLDQFYTTAISTTIKTYKIDMNIENGKVTAYADCQKLTARYKIDDNVISFSKVGYGIDLDHASCQQSEDADQAVYEFLYNSFEVTKINEDEITFQSEDFDVEVVLKR